jgi:hypothetical protein
MILNAVCKIIITLLTGRDNRKGIAEKKGFSTIPL